MSLKHLNFKSKKKKGDGYAVLRGTVIAWGHWNVPRLVVYCPYCEEVHAHGVTDGLRSGKKEARGAHCGPNNGSPFHETGYYIAVLRKKDMKEMSIQNKTKMNGR